MSIKKSVLGLILSGIIICTSTITAFATGDYKEAVSLGANLTTAQKEQMLNQFGVSNEQVKNGKVQVIEITNQDIREQLGMDMSKPIPKDSVSISSSFVKVTPKGSGIKVTTNHMTQVTGTMLSNALITCGVTDADIKAGAPYDVTGTAALAGVLKGFEKSTGKELPLENRKVAQDEITVTKNLGDSIGKEKASSMVNQVKTEVVKDKPGDKKAIENIINDTAKDYQVSLNPEDKQQLVDLMTQVRKLNLNYDQIKNSLNKLGDEMKNQLTQAGIKIKESGFFEKMWEGVKNFFHWIDLKLNGDKFENKPIDNQLQDIKNSTNENNNIHDTKVDSNNSNQNNSNTSENTTEGNNK